MKRRKLAVMVETILVGVTLTLTGCGATGEKQQPTQATNDLTQTGEQSQEGMSETLKKLREKGTLVVGSSGDAPFAYIDQATGEFKGVDAEIIKEAAQRLGIDKVEMSLIPFSELILNVNSDNIDIIADCMYIRGDRAEQIYYGDIWYTQGGALLVPEEGSIKGQDTFDPAHTVIGYTSGTVWQTFVEQWESEGLIKEARATGDQTESIVALQYGKIDGFLTDSTVAEDLFKNSPDTVKGIMMAPEYTDPKDAIGRIAPAVSFDHIDFMKELNETVAELREEGFIEQVFKDYGLDPALHMITNEQAVHDVNTR